MSDEPIFSLAALAQAAQNGIALPHEFEPLMRRAHPGRSARYVDRNELLAWHGGYSPPPAPEPITDSHAPTREIKRLITALQQGQVGTSIPNVYRGPLDDHEPRMDGPAWEWGL